MTMRIAALLLAMAAFAFIGCEKESQSKNEKAAEEPAPNADEPAVDQGEAPPSGEGETPAPGGEPAAGQGDGTAADGTAAGERTVDSVCPDLAAARAATPPESCTEMGCDSGARVNVQRDEWPAGEYAFAIVVDGVTTECTGTLPGTDCNIFSCTNPGVMVSVTPCGGGQADGKVDTIELKGLPEKVDVKVTHGGAEIGSGALELEYKGVVANGPGCGPYCCQGTATLGL